MVVPELVVAVGGMALLAVGVWRIESRAPRRAIAILLCVCGIVLIGIAAARAGLNWSLRLTVLGLYSGTGGVVGSLTATILVRRRAGAILASLGTTATTGFKVISAIYIPAGILSVVMQFLEAHRNVSLLMLVGQALLFTTFGVQAVSMVKGRWSLADQGIVGPNGFIPWQQVSAWDWQNSNTLAIVLKPGFRRARGFTIPVEPEARELVAVILTSKIPA